jgi:hypothetical protein
MNAPRSNYNDPQRGALPPVAAAAPSPPYNTGGGTQREAEQYLSREAPYNPHDAREVPQRSQPPQQQEQPPSPTRKSIFDFVSPFDALAPSSGPVKKKPPPQAPSVSSGNEDSWTSVSLPTDPKRNLMDQLTRGQAPPSVQAPQLAYDPYMAGEDLSEPIHSRVPPPPLPPKPNRTASPRLSPPKVNATHRPQPRLAESPVGQLGAPATVARKDKDNSPAPRGPFKAKGATAKNKTQSSPRCVPIRSYVFCRPLKVHLFAAHMLKVSFSTFLDLSRTSKPLVRLSSLLPLL